MTEGKLLAMFSEAVGSAMDPDYLSGLVASYYDLECPRYFKARCTEGFLAGVELRQLLFTLDGQTSDDAVERAIAMLFEQAVDGGVLSDDSENVPSVIFEKARWSLGHHQEWGDPFSLGEALAEA